MKLGGKLRIYPVNISPRDLAQKIFIAREFRDEIKRGGVFSRTQEIQFERARDSRGFKIGLEAQEKLVESSQSCAPKMKSKSITQRHKKRGDWIDSKRPEGTKRMGPPFPIKSNTKSHESIAKSYSKEKNGGRETQGRRPRRKSNSRTSYKNHTT